MTIVNQPYFYLNEETTMNPFIHIDMIQLKQVFQLRLSENCLVSLMQILVQL